MMAVTSYGNNVRRKHNEPRRNINETEATTLRAHIFKATLESALKGLGAQQVTFEGLEQAKRTALEANRWGQRTINRKTRLAHRVAWEEVHGPIPDGLVVRHKCDNRACINVDHLELGTHKDNRHDAARRHGPHRQNKSGVQGVTWVERDNRWKCHVQKDGKVSTCYQPTLIDAVAWTLRTRHNLYGEIK